MCNCETYKILHYRNMGVGGIKKITSVSKVTLSSELITNTLDLHTYCTTSRHTHSHRLRKAKTLLQSRYRLWQRERELHSPAVGTWTSRHRRAADTRPRSAAPRTSRPRGDAAWCSRAVCAARGKGLACAISGPVWQSRLTDCWNCLAGPRAF